MLDLENLNKKVDKFFNQFKDIDSEISHKLHTSYWEEQTYTNIPEHIVIYCFNGFFVTIYRRFRTNFMSFIKRLTKDEFDQDDYLFTFKVEKDGFEIKNLEECYLIVDNAIDFINSEYNKMKTNFEDEVKTLINNFSTKG